MHSLALPSPLLLLQSPFSPSLSRRLSRPLLPRRLKSTKVSNTRPPLSSTPLSAASPSKKPFSDAEDDDDGDDDDHAADEYDDPLLAEVSEEDEEEEEEEVEGDDDEVHRYGADPSLQSEEHKSKRVERLINQARELGTEIIDLEELSYIYDFPIDKFQRLAIQAFLRGSSVIVSAPTSSGKTLIAEAAAVATIARGRRLLYTTPLKALSNQKFRDFRATFGENNVGLLTGDSAVNKDARILIMTTEILRNMLYQSVGMVSSESKLFNVDVIVLDEVHYLSDISRGTVWEEIVIYCPKDVQLICLSATVANPNELSGWIGQIHGKTELVTSTKRPVPLIWHFSLKNSLLPLLEKKGTKMNRKLSFDNLQLSALRTEPYNESRSRKHRLCKSEQGLNHIASISRQTQLTKNDISSIRRTQVPQIRDTLRHLRAKDMLPAIWFIFSRRGCDAAVQYLEEDCNLLDECESAEVELEFRRFRVQHPDAVREVAIKGLLRGIAAHHAGCLPLWKSFIEQLFQRSLVKVVFATETLAAGINMPARTAVIASLTRRGETGRTLLSLNELLQMAGRAGRRGIDEVGHVVLVQTPYEAAEQCCELLFSRLDPLVSQFTASYGMVLNLLAGAKVTRKSKDPDDMKASHGGRSLDEAKKLVEQSFGNYVGSNVMIEATEELSRVENEIELLTLNVTEDAIDRKCHQELSETEYAEISSLQEQLRVEKRLRTKHRRSMELSRMVAWKQLLNKFEHGLLPFICLHYKDNESVQHIVPAVYVGKLASFPASKVMAMLSGESSLLETIGTNLDSIDINDQEHEKPVYYVALGAENSWYLFTEKWVKAAYRTGLPCGSVADGDLGPREKLRDLLMKEEMQWEKLVDSEFGPLWWMEGSIETWSWSLNVPVLSSLSEDDEVKHESSEYQEAVESYKEQRSKVSRLKKRITSTKGFKEFKKIIDMTNFTKEKIQRLKGRSKRLSRRIEQIEPSGWKEFLQVSKVIQQARALDINTHVIYPLGETAAAIRGENELWLAMVLRNKILLDLKPAQLAAVCGSLVSGGIKVRPWKNSSYLYEPSSIVTDVINLLEEQRCSLLKIQNELGVQIPCELDNQFSGMVEAWASGLTWREMMMDCAMDEGDLARLLRRTIDLLVQIPKLPDIDPWLQNSAQLASSVMDRTPISELTG